MKKLKLTELSKITGGIPAIPEYLVLSNPDGSQQCGCACAYAGQGGSSTGDNGNANFNGNLHS